MATEEKSSAIASAIMAHAIRVKDALKNIKSPSKRAFKLTYNRRPLSKRRKALAISTIVASSLSAAVQIRVILSQPKPKNHE